MIVIRKTDTMKGKIGLQIPLGNTEIASEHVLYENWQNWVRRGVFNKQKYFLCFFGFT